MEVSYILMLHEATHGSLCKHREGQEPLMKQIGFEERDKRRVSGQWTCPAELNRRTKIEGIPPALYYRDKGKLIAHMCISTYLKSF